MNDPLLFTFDYYKKAADYIKSKINGFEPEIGMILGSGLNNYAQRVEKVAEIPYQKIPNFLISTAPGHEGKLIFGTVEGRRVVIMAGRFHHYEGYSYQQLAIPVRVLKLLGIKTLIVTNAAGAVNTDYKVGDLMIIKDHINFTGECPMVGKNVDEFGIRFYDCCDVYSKELRKIALDVSKTSDMTVHEGVYFFYPGPNFETPAEIRAERVLGADATGMSTITEALTAAHCGLPCLGMSLICNMAAGVLEEKLSGDDVNKAAAAAAEKLEIYFSEVLRRLP